MNGEEINAVRISELEKRITLHSEQSQMAIKLAANDLKTRLDNMNEFRMALKDAQATYITKDEYEYALKDIRELRESRAELHGRATVQSVVWAYIISVAGLIVGLVGIFHR